MRVQIGNIAAAFGKGIFAGVAGTAVMTLSSTVEMKLQERPGEKSPIHCSRGVGIPRRKLVILQTLLLSLQTFESLRD